ncbi:MAG TPA: hypothetical protein VF881_04250 [Polyangiaceae bacterium]
MSAPPTTVTPAAPAPPAGYRIILFESIGRPSMLQVDWLWGSQEKKSWVAVCESPCRASVAPGAVFRVAGPGVRASSPFAIPDSATHVAAETGSRGGYVTGVILLSAGAAVGGIGLTLLAADYGSAGGSHETAPEMGMITLAGLATGVVGFVLMLNNRTNVSVWANTNAPTRTASVAPRLTSHGFVF